MSNTFDDDFISSVEYGLDGCVSSAVRVIISLAVLGEEKEDYIDKIMDMDNAVQVCIAPPPLTLYRSLTFLNHACLLTIRSILHYW